MGTSITANTLKHVHSAEYGNRTVYTDEYSVLTTDLQAADVVKLCRIPAGTLVDRVVVKNTDLDSNATPTLTAKLGFSPTDGSAAPTADVTAIAANAAWGQAAATTTYEIFPPYEVAKDSYVTIIVGTGAATAATGTLNVKVEGEGLGVA